MFHLLKKQNLLRFCACFMVICFMLSGCASVSASRSDYPELTHAQTTPPPAPPIDTRPRVALTYDDGPHVTRTKLIVDELDKYGYHATFFVVGNRVDGTEYNGGAAMVYAAEHGNEIGIHGYTHDTDHMYDSCTDERYVYEISNTVRAIQQKLPGYEIRLMRPVGGAITGTRIIESPYAIIHWNVDTLDYRYRSPEGDNEQIDVIVENALKDISDGDIILMHDIYNNTYEATVIILARLYEMGYNVVTVSELLGSEWCPGTKYSYAPKGVQ